MGTCFDQPPAGVCQESRFVARARAESLANQASAMCGSMLKSCV